MWVHFPQPSPATQELGAFSAHLDTPCLAQREGIHGSLVAPQLLSHPAGLFPSLACLQLLPSLCRKALASADREPRVADRLCTL